MPSPWQPDPIFNTLSTSLLPFDTIIYTLNEGKGLTMMAVEVNYTHMAEKGRFPVIKEKRLVEVRPDG